MHAHLALSGVGCGLLAELYHFRRNTLAGVPDGFHPEELFTARDAKDAGKQREIEEEKPSKNTQSLTLSSLSCLAISFAFLCVPLKGVLKGILCGSMF
jgi:hypothetical protein